MNQTKFLCYTCLEECEGGTYIDEPKRRIYFCSGKCLDKYSGEER